MFRGLTVALMILVNSPGSWAHIHAPLRHAAWNGLTPTDLVFPFFLFIVGTAMSLSFTRRLNDGATRGDLVRKVLARSAIIFVLGLLLNGFPFDEPLSTWRIPGVLQRIGLCYLLAGLTVVLGGRNRNRWLVVGGFLLLYEFLMRWALVSGWGAGSFALANNFVRWVDLSVLGESHMFTVRGLAFDPDGLVSTLPAAVTTLAGYFAGEFIRGPGGLPEKLRRLGIVGGGVAALGLLLCPLEPVNKQLWTVSYVLVTTGLAMAALAASSWMIDVKKWRTGIRPAVVFGSNPLVAFVGSGLVARILILVKVDAGGGDPIILKRWIYEGFFVPIAGPLNGSFLFAVATVLLWLGLLWLLYRRGWFLKI